MQVDHTWDCARFSRSRLRTVDHPTTKHQGPESFECRSLEIFGSYIRLRFRNRPMGIAWCQAIDAISRLPWGACRGLAHPRNYTVAIDVRTGKSLSLSHGAGQDTVPSNPTANAPHGNSIAASSAQIWTLSRSCALSRFSDSVPEATLAPWFCIASCTAGQRTQVPANQRLVLWSIQQRFEGPSVYGAPSRPLNHQPPLSSRATHHDVSDARVAPRAGEVACGCMRLFHGF
ncbi:hypothetical protein BJ170DRAFT_13692 [Xylariales sp. AK1849]|nr:hypothetical protein BJ170DRAFT_13692 [Xylariales sp. AK1849]